MVYKSTRSVKFKRKIILILICTQSAFLCLPFTDRKWLPIISMNQIRLGWLIEQFSTAKIKSNLTKPYRKTRVNGKYIFYLALEAGIVILGGKPQICDVNSALCI